MDRRVKSGLLAFDKSVKIVVSAANRTSNFLKSLSCNRRWRRYEDDSFEMQLKVLHVHRSNQKKSWTEGAKPWWFHKNYIHLGCDDARAMPKLHWSNQPSRRRAECLREFWYWREREEKDNPELKNYELRVSQIRNLFFENSPHCSLERNFFWSFKWLEASSKKQMLFNFFLLKKRKLFLSVQFNLDELSDLGLKCWCSCLRFICNSCFSCLRLNLNHTFESVFLFTFEFIRFRLYCSYSCPYWNSEFIFEFIFEFSMSSSKLPVFMLYRAKFMFERHSCLTTIHINHIWISACITVLIRVYAFFLFRLDLRFFYC